MTRPQVVPIPLWRTPRRTAVLFVILGALVLLFGIGLYLDSLELEAELGERLRPDPPRPSESSPTSTSS